MRRVLRLAVVLGMIGIPLLAEPAHAVNASTCSPSGGPSTGAHGTTAVAATNEGAENAVAIACTYVSQNGAADAQGFAASTPNDWTIKVGTTVVKSSDGLTGPNQDPVQGNFTAAQGSTVTVTILVGCAPGGAVCGAIGSVAAGAATSN